MGEAWKQHGAEAACPPAGLLACAGWSACVQAGDIVHTAGTAATRTDVGSALSFDAPSTYRSLQEASGDALHPLFRPVRLPQALELQGQGWTIVDVRLAGDFEKVRDGRLPLCSCETILLAAPVKRVCCCGPIPCARGRTALAPRASLLVALAVLYGNPTSRNGTCAYSTSHPHPPVRALFPLPLPPQVRAEGAISLPLYRYVEGTSFWDNVKKAAMAVGFAMRATGACGEACVVEGKGGYAGRSLFRFRGGTVHLLPCVGATSTVLMPTRPQATGADPAALFVSSTPRPKGTQGTHEQQAAAQTLMSCCATRPSSSACSPERDPDYRNKALATLQKNQKIILMCAIGGTLDTLVGGGRYDTAEARSDAWGSSIAAVLLVSAFQLVPGSCAHVSPRREGGPCHACTGMHVRPCGNAGSRGAPSAFPNAGVFIVVARPRALTRTADWLLPIANRNVNNPAHPGSPNPLRTSSRPCPRACQPPQPQAAYPHTKPPLHCTSTPYTFAPFAPRWYPLFVSVSLTLPLCGFPPPPGGPAQGRQASHPRPGARLRPRVAVPQGRVRAAPGGSAQPCVRALYAYRYGTEWDRPGHMSCRWSGMHLCNSSCGLRGAVAAAAQYLPLHVTGPAQRPMAAGRRCGQGTTLDRKAQGALYSKLCCAKRSLTALWAALVPGDVVQGVAQHWAQGVANTCTVLVLLPCAGWLERQQHVLGGGRAAAVALQGVAHRGRRCLRPSSALKRLVGWL